MSRLGRMYLHFMQLPRYYCILPVFPLVILKKEGEVDILKALGSPSGSLMVGAC